MKKVAEKITKAKNSKKVVNQKENKNIAESRFNEADKKFILEAITGAFKNEREHTVSLFKNEREYTASLFKNEREYTDKRFVKERVYTDKRLEQIDKRFEEQTETLLGAINEQEENAERRFLAMFEHKDDNAKIYKDINNDIYSKLKVVNVRVDSLDLRVSELENV